MSSRLEKKKPANKPESKKKESGASRLDTGKKKEPGMLQLTVTLCGICAVCALLLGLTNMVTEPVIEANAEAKKTAAIAEKVLPGFTGTLTQVNYVGGDSSVKSVQKGSDGSFVVEVSPKSSFSGNLTLLIGIWPDKTISGLSVSASGETEGIGSNALKDEYFAAQYVGKTGPVELTKNGGEVEGITGASYTSGAVKDAVNSAFEAIENTNDAPFDPSLVPAEPTVSENIISMSQEGDGYVAVVDCGSDSFSKKLVLRVSLDAGKAVSAIEVLESEETQGVGSNALTTEYFQKFVGQSGTAEVDAYSGATFTSTAVGVGVNAVLQAADYPDQWPQGTVGTADSAPANDVDVKSVEQSGDGYEVTVDCGNLSFSKKLVLKVSIDANKAVSAIEVVESDETQGVGSNALTPEHLQQFVGKTGTVEVDGVGGATYTSEAVNAGVNAALKAVDSQG